MRKYQWSGSRRAKSIRAGVLNDASRHEFSLGLYAQADITSETVGVGFD